MSIVYITRCDFCRTEEQEWPNSSYGSMPNWAAVQIEGDRFDYCPTCWAKLQKSIEMGVAK